MPSGLFSLRLIFEHLKSESLHNVIITKNGYTLSYDFSQTENRFLVTGYFVFVLSPENIMFFRKKENLSSERHMVS